MDTLQSENDDLGISLDNLDSAVLKLDIRLNRIEQKDTKLQDQVTGL